MFPRDELGLIRSFLYLMSVRKPETLSRVLADTVILLMHFVIHFLFMKPDSYFQTVLQDCMVSVERFLLAVSVTLGIERQ